MTTYDLELYIFLYISRILFKKVNITSASSAIIGNTYNCTATKAQQSFI